MDVRIEKISDWEIALIRSNLYSGLAHVGSSITTTFNFLSAQVTTVTRDAMREHSSGAAYAVAVSTQMKIQNFYELGSLREVERARGELVRMGGTPPEMSELMADSVKVVSALQRDITVRKIEVKS